ncbi:MAG: dihydropteroate synthase [Phyllobacteriaceae bacterium]|nr:dihydropteroate synthase [Phyllobacteriaceae bacterium]
MKRWALGHGRHLELGKAGLVMGVVNVTPDSFSDGGAFLDAKKAIEQARRLAAEGAAILDIGGESTRPGAAAVPAAEEQARILPVIRRLAALGDFVLSVDTWRAETARLAIGAGAHIINDVHGLQRDPSIADVAAASGAGLVIMHTGRDRERLSDPIADQFAFFARSLAIARQAGVRDSQIALDPGFGFAKETVEANTVLMARFRDLKALGFPLVVGTSRKRFLGVVTGRDSADRDVATAASSALLRVGGADVFRVHNVAMTVDALRVADAMLSASQPEPDAS